MTAPQNSGLSYLRLNARTGGEHSCFYQQYVDGVAINAPGRWHTQTVIDDRSYRTSTKGIYFSLFEDSNIVFVMSLPLSQGKGSWVKKVTGPSQYAPTKTFGGASVYHNGAIYFMTGLSTAARYSNSLCHRILTMTRPG